MLWRQFPARLDITPDGRPILQVVAIAMAAAGVLAIAISQVGWSVKAVLGVSLAALVLSGWRRYLAPDGAGVVRRLLYDRRRGWRIVDGRGHEVRVVPARGTFVAPWLTLLWLRATGRRRYLLALPAGGPSHEATRRLRVVLRAGSFAWS